MPYFMADDHFTPHIMLINPVTWRHNCDHNYGYKYAEGDNEVRWTILSNYNRNYDEDIRLTNNTL